MQTLTSWQYDSMLPEVPVTGPNDGSYEAPCHVQRKSCSNPREWNEQGKEINWQML